MYYKDIFESIRNEAEKRITCVKELFNCALMSVTSFVGLEKMFLILKMRGKFSCCQTSGEGLLETHNLSVCNKVLI